MVKKLQKASPAKATPSKKSPVQLTGAVKDSAQQIWLAGLAAFTKAQTEGNKVFDTLVKEGLSIQRKTQAVAEEKITEATSKMAGVANGITSKATGQWDKLETIFEERVAKALNKLGVPSAKDVDALIARIDALNASVQKLSKAPAAKATPKAAPKAATPKAAARPAKTSNSGGKPTARRASVRKKTAAAPSEASAG